MLVSKTVFFFFNHPMCNILRARPIKNMTITVVRFKEIDATYFYLSLLLKQFLIPLHSQSK